MVSDGNLIGRDGFLCEQEALGPRPPPNHSLDGSNTLQEVLRVRPHPALDGVLARVFLQGVEVSADEATSLSLCEASMSGGE
jgi:hypothetical protein